MTTPYTSARSVSWRSVHRFVLPALDAVKHWPGIGTPAWRLLPNDDPAKWASILDAAQHHALRLELGQTALAEAAQDISASEDWKKIAAEYLKLSSFRENNPWSKRVVAS